MRYYMAGLLLYAAVCALVLWPYAQPDPPPVRHGAPVAGLAWLVVAAFVAWVPLQLWVSRGRRP